MPFKKGQSGNPGGRTRPNPDVVVACRALTPKAIAVLEQVMDTGLHGDRLRAAEAILNRAWGTAPQRVELSGVDGGPIEHNVADYRARVLEGIARSPEVAAGSVGEDSVTH